MIIVKILYKDITRNFKYSLSIKYSSVKPENCRVDRRQGKHPKDRFEQSSLDYLPSGKNEPNE